MKKKGKNSSSQMTYDTDMSIILRNDKNVQNYQACNSVKCNLIDVLSKQKAQKPHNNFHPLWVSRLKLKIILNIQ